MANELSWRHTATGETLYATVRSIAGTMWNGAALEVLTVANWGDYDFALTETPASGYFYVGDWPGAAVGWYWVDVFKKLGGSVAIGDLLLGSLLGYWDGTTFKPWNAGLIAADLMDDADAIETGFTLRQVLRIMAAVLAGKVSGAGSGVETFLGLDGSTERVEVTVDAGGNRTDVDYS